MNRWLQIGSVVIAGIAALGVFQIKFRAESIVERVEDAERRLAEEKEMVSLLSAEWSYLVQPGRIQSLTERFFEELQLQPLEPDQIGSIDTLPAAPVAIKSMPPEIRHPMPRPDIGAQQ